MPKFLPAYTAKHLFFIFICVFLQSCLLEKETLRKPFNAVRTITGLNREIGEPFGIAEKKGTLFVSDGEKGNIWKILKDGKLEIFATDFDTPSHIAFDGAGNLIVADSGSHTIKKVSRDGQVELVAGVEGEKGYRDGGARSALFNAPIGVAVFENKIFVADTYNDRIRVIENGRVTTLAGGEQGFADSTGGGNAQFDTPIGIAMWTGGGLLVADSGNRLIRVVEKDGKTWTLSGNGHEMLKDGLLHEASFVRPTAINVNNQGVIYIADGNAIRAIGRRSFPIVETISNGRLGFADGKMLLAQFNRPSGLVSDSQGNLFVTDSANQLVRVFTSGEKGSELSRQKFERGQISSKEFRKISAPRWTYDPPKKAREIAGTLGEIRGEVKDEESQAWFHNGLDIVGGYGETARFVRDEKVLRPIAVQNFDTTRELIRMPTLGYIHIRLGRNVQSEPFEDKRFQFSFDGNGKPDGLRIPRGAKFKAGEAIGTLNRFNHVHLIAGRAGREMNALDALILPGVVDKRTPTIEAVTFYHEDWAENETEKRRGCIELVGKTRIVVRAFDQMDGNAARRKLGIYKLGYQAFTEDKKPVLGFENPKWTIIFDKFPDSRAVNLVYAKGSKSGSTGETIFRYIVTNRVSGNKMRESFFDASKLRKGNYILRVFAADFFGNIASNDIEFMKKDSLQEE